MSRKQDMTIYLTGVGRGDAMTGFVFDDEDTAKEYASENDFRVYKTTVKIHEDRLTAIYTPGEEEDDDGTEA